MKFHNPFKPHIVRVTYGQDSFYAIRKGFPHSDDYVSIMPIMDGTTCCTPKFIFQYCAIGTLEEARALLNVYKTRVDKKFKIKHVILNEE
jgi:hypothetical protein